ncbi:MAG: hypothetical protein HC802_09565 [Caldilineaceae bacterium]|nr:hypothetical protein [Caldilineaceae bacterium]
MNSHQTREQDTGRYIAREVSALSDDVSLAQYAVADQRKAATGRAVERWQRLRGYLRRTKLR